MQQIIDAIRLIAATDTNYEFHTPSPDGTIHTDLSAGSARNYCDCGQWRRGEGCDHTRAAVQYLAEQLTIEQMLAEDDPSDFLATMDDEMFDACPECYHPLDLVRGEVEDFMSCGACSKEVAV